MALEKIGHLGGFEAINLFASEANRTELPFLLKGGESTGPLSCIAINTYGLRRAGIILETKYPDEAEYSEAPKYASLNGGIYIWGGGLAFLASLKTMGWGDVVFASPYSVSTRSWIICNPSGESSMSGTISIGGVETSGVGAENAKTCMFIPRILLKENTFIVYCSIEEAEGYELEITGIRII